MKWRKVDIDRKRGIYIFLFILFTTFLSLSSIDAGGKIPAIIIPYDSVTMPGVEVWPQALVVSRRFYALERPVGGERIEFLEGERSLGIALTGGDGIGVIRYIPYREGIHRIKVRLLSNSAYEAGEGEMIIGVWDRERPLLLVSVDALWERPKVSSFPFIGSRLKKVEDRHPLPQSATILSEMSKRFSIVYLYRGEISRIPDIRSWLFREGFPGYPLLVLGDDKRAFDRLLSDRKEDIKGVVITQEEDADIFRKERLRTLLLLDKKGGERDKDRKGTIPVRDWGEVRKVLY